MPLTNKGKKIMKSMKDEYGEKRGEKIFHASKNAKKITDVEGKSGAYKFKPSKKK